MKIAAAPILLALSLASPAAAQSIVPAVSMNEARQIAAEAGVVAIESIEMDDDGRWEIEGRNSAGQEMDIEIDATTGRIVSMDTDDDDDMGTVGRAPM